MRGSQGTFLVVGLTIICSTVLLKPVNAQRSGAQKYLVRVPQSIALIAPGAAVIRHDLTDDLQTFPQQIWRVRGNVSRGVSVKFHVDSPFVHEADDSLRRDVTLSLAAGSTSGAADWTITTPFDQTNHVRGDNDATVTARSDGAGAAELLVSVSFVTGAVELLLEGNYYAVVIGTVAANN